MTSFGILSKSPVGCVSCGGTHGGEASREMVREGNAIWLAQEAVWGQEQAYVGEGDSSVAAEEGQQGTDHAPAPNEGQGGALFAQGKGHIEERPGPFDEQEDLGEVEELPGPMVIRPEQEEDPNPSRPFVPLPEVGDADRDERSPDFAREPPPTVLEPITEVHPGRPAYLNPCEDYFEDLWSDLPDHWSDLTPYPPRGHTLTPPPFGNLVPDCINTTLPGQGNTLERLIEECGEFFCYEWRPFPSEERIADKTADFDIKEGHPKIEDLIECALTLLMDQSRLISYLTCFAMGWGGGGLREDCINDKLRNRDTKIRWKHYGPEGPRAKGRWNGDRIFINLDHPSVKAMRDAYQRGGADAKCACVVMASLLLHELVHNCGSQGHKKANADCSTPDRIENSFLWAMSQLYPDVSNSKCCRHLDNPDNWFSNRAIWMRERCLESGHPYEGDYACPWHGPGSRADPPFGWVLTEDGLVYVGDPSLGDLGGIDGAGWGDGGPVILLDGVELP